ncbi:cardioacceleratory peptide receptor-like [Ylistrum balloti]|uniref:cardioacceleratory peptide receptor-like n=1 Tax=Ylistrum balloti TaxID=509963 RepID=UPI002905C66B|nr:cardioacceleratory peptide receptor-like [Ylistrum balloti]
MQVSTTRGVTGLPVITSGHMVYNVSTETSNNEVQHGGEEPYYFQRERIIFDSCIFAAIIIGNLIVLLAVWISRKKRRSRMTFFIQQLAIADLLVGLFSVLPDLVLMVDGKWKGGDPVCKIVKYLQGVVTYGSTYMLVALSVDRWDAVARPIDGITNANLRCKVLTISAWAVAALFSLPMFLFEDIQGSCMINYFEEWQWQLYLVLIAVAVFFIPTVIIIYCYGAIIHILLQKTFECTDVKPKRDRSDVSPKNGYKAHKTSRGFRNGKRRSLSRSSRGIIPQAKIRTIKMTTGIVIVFILCWSPYFIVNLLGVFGHLDFSSQLVVGLYAFIQSLAPLNSALNPVIYGIFSSRTCHHLVTFSYRGQLRRTCPCCKRCLKEPNVLIPRWSHTDVSYSTCRQTITPDKSTDMVKPSDSTELCDLVVTSDMLEEHSRC